MDIVIETTLQHVPARRRHTPSGWESFNCVCCHHLGHKPDRRGRGGIRVEHNALRYHCFNCGYTASHTVGTRINNRYETLLGYFGVDDGVIQRLKLLALARVDSTVEAVEPVIYEYESRGPCPGRTIEECVNDAAYYARYREHLDQLLVYLDNRGLIDAINVLKYDHDERLCNRFLIPFTWRKREVGYTARAFTSSTKPRYLNNYPSNILYGYDRQHYSRQYVIVVEGVLDALQIDGVAICGNEISQVQAELINVLGRRVIVVPDRDEAGKRMVDAAIQYGWSVSYPNWEPHIKDVSDACVNYGKLYTMKSILMNTYKSGLQIQLYGKNWF